MKEFPLAVDNGEIIFSDNDIPRKLRLTVCDNSYIDVYISKDKYSFHWDRKMVSNEIYRHDNAPHKRWSKIKTFPKHFHNRSEDNVEVSYISDKPEDALKEFLEFVQHILIGRIDE